MFFVCGHCWLWQEQFQPGWTDELKEKQKDEYKWGNRESAQTIFWKFSWRGEQKNRGITRDFHFKVKYY